MTMIWTHNKHYKEQNWRSKCWRHEHGLGSGSRLRRSSEKSGRSSAWAAISRLSLFAGIVLSLPGCASFGPPSVDRDRFDYINAIASSWKQQTLLNIVKMRYADTPVFLDVGQIISGYQLQGAVTVGGSLNSASAVGDILNLGSAATYIDRPTITYTPLTGAHFMQVMITPIPPPALLMRAEEGWPIDTLLQIGAQSINGLSNRKGGARGHAADPDFVRLLAALQRLQASGVIDLRVEVSKESKQEGTVMVISHEGSSPRNPGRSRTGQETFGAADRSPGVQDSERHGLWKR